MVPELVKAEAYSINDGAPIKNWPAFTIVPTVDVSGSKTRRQNGIRTESQCVATICLQKTVITIRRDQR